MFCKNCGNENPDSTKFCRFCGTAIENVNADATPVAPQPVAVPVNNGQMPMNNGPMGTPMNNGPMGAPMNNGPMGAPMNNSPMGAPMNNGPMGAPMNNGPMGAPMNNGPMGAPMNNGPMGAPMNNGPMGAPMNNGPMGAPMNNGPMSMNNGIPVGKPVSMPYYPGAVPPANPQKKGGGAAKIVIIILILLILIGIGVIATIFIGKSLNSGKIDDKITAAQELSDDGEFADAEEAYLEALEMKEDSADAINGLTDNYLAWADSLIEEGDYEGALEVLEDADEQAKPKKIKAKIEEIKEMIGGFGEVVSPEYPADDNGGSAFTASGDDFSGMDLIFVGSESLPVEVDHAIIVYDDVTYYTDYATGDYVEYNEEFSTYRGLSLGMTLEDYLNMYNVVPGNAVWELYSGSENEYTSFATYYEGDTAEDFYYDDYNNVWLDIGFSLEDGYWRQMEDWEVQDTWFCDAYLEDYEEVIVFAVNIDSWGYVTGISLEHFTYDEGWVEWQGWAE